MNHALKNIAGIRGAEYNPRGIDGQSLEGLKFSQGQFGDISGIVYNERTGNQVTGHQRMKGLIEEFGEDKLRLIDITIEDTPQEETHKGILTPTGVLWIVRVVDWPVEKEMAANVAANSALLAGHWSDGLGDLLDGIGEALPELVGPLRLDVLALEEAMPSLPPPVDEHVADGISLCKCPECGHEHHREDKP